MLSFYVLPSKDYTLFLRCLQILEFNYKNSFKCEKNTIKKFRWCVQEIREKYVLNIILYRFTSGFTIYFLKIYKNKIETFNSIGMFN